MRILSLSLALATTIGCAAGAGIDDPPGSNMPAYCAEDQREVVTDPSVAAAGFAFPASDAITAQAGPFAGDLTRESDTTSLALTIAVDRVDAVSTVLVDPGGSDTGPQMGAPEQDLQCQPYYDLAITGTLAAADGTIDESFHSASRVYDTASGAFSAAIALGDVHGTARPVLDPSAWDAVALQIDATLDNGSWVGSITWMASNDTSNDTDSFVYDTATGTGTGTVDVSGMTEPIGTFALVPQ